MNLRIQNRYLRTLLGAFCLFLSLNGWAAEEQPKPTRRQQIVECVKGSLELLVLPIKIIKSEEAQNVFSELKKDIRNPNRVIQAVGKSVKNKWEIKKQSAKEKWEYQKEYWTEVRESNGKRLLKTGANAAKSVARIPYNQQMKYWTQVVGRCQEAKSVHGCIGNVVHRFVFVKRENPEKINLRQYLNPMNLYSAPFTIGPELLRAKYNFSAPSQLILGLPAMIAATMAYDHVMIHGAPFGIFKDMDDVAEEIPGVDYILGVYHQDLMDTSFAEDSVGFHASTRARHMMNQHALDLFNWVDHKGDPAFLPKVQDLKSVGVLKNDDDAKALSQLAYQTYLSVGKKFSEGFPERLDKAWKEALRKDPRYSKLSLEDLKLLELFFSPSIKFGKVSDLELMARSLGKKTQSSGASNPLHALKGVAKDLSPPVLLKLAVATLDGASEIANKQARWKKLSIGGDQPFLHRTDLPSLAFWGDVSFDSDGRGAKPKLLNDELSYWELAFKDPRFADIGAAYKKGEIGEVDAVGFVYERIAAYNEIYTQGRSKAKPDVKKLCLWLNGSSEGDASVDSANPLIARQVPGYLDLIRGPRKLTSVQEEGCRIDLGEYLYGSYMGEVNGIRGDAPAMQPKEFIHGLNRALSLCPLQSPPRSCPK